MPLNLDPVRAWLASVWQYLLAGSVALNLFLGLGFYVQGVRMHSWKVEAKAEKAGRKADKTVYEQAQKEAERLALDQKKDLERKYDDYKQSADRGYADLRRKYDAALLRVKTSHSTSGKPVGVSPEAAASPAGSSGTGEDPVIPTRLSDLAICAENTAKAVIAHDWAAKVSAAQNP